MRRVLIVEDEPALSQSLADILTAREYEVEVAERGDTGLAVALDKAFDLILLDLMLPGISGFEVLRGLRAAARSTPVIMLTARGDVPDKVLGFDLGVDDYVTKPFSPLELLGRIGAVLRRSRIEAPDGGQGEDHVLDFGPVTIDVKAFSALRGGEPLDLPAKGFEILRVLAAMAGQVVERQTLIEQVWGKGEYLNPRSLANLMGRIRQVIEPDPAAPRYLKTIHGIGYKLELGE